jgi:acyl dehydratase
MPLDLSFVGRSYPPSEPYLVSRERIREFADAIGADDPAYRDHRFAAELGHPDVIAPPTFPILISNLVGQVVINDPELGMDYSRVVHGDQRFEYTRPVRAGDRLVSVISVEDITSRGGHDFVTIRTDITSETGEEVVRVWCKLVVRGEG